MHARFVSTTIIIALMSVAPAWSQGAQADRAFLERASLRASDDACQLFTPGERLALEAGFWQSRGALLRGGHRLEQVDALNAEASAYALQKGCRDSTLIAASERLRDAFTAFSRTPFIEYFGQYGSWTASRAQSDNWAAVQPADNGARLGLFNVEEDAAPSPAAFIPLAEGAPAPAAARIFARDPLKSDRPWFGGVFGPSNGLIAAPMSVSEAFWPSERQSIEAGRGSPAGVVFLFPPAVQDRLNELDPREAVWVEFTPSPRLKNAAPTRAIFEIGDFRAAAAFAAIPRTEVQTPEQLAAAQGGKS